MFLIWAWIFKNIKVFDFVLIKHLNNMLILDRVVFDMIS